MNWLTIKQVGLLNGQRVVAVGLAESAPMKRLLQAMPDWQVIVLTGGEKRQTAVVLDSGHIVLTALSLSEITTLLQRCWPKES